MVFVFKYFLKILFSLIRDYENIKIQLLSPSFAFQNGFEICISGVMELCLQDFGPKMSSLEVCVKVCGPCRCFIKAFVIIMTCKFIKLSSKICICC